MEHHKKQVKRIQYELAELDTKKGRLFDAYLDGKISITQSMYDKKLQEISDKEQQLCIELEEHLQGDTDYKTTVALVFSLARRARQLFDGSEVIEKQQLLRLLLQNCTLHI